MIRYRDSIEHMEMRTSRPITGLGGGRVSEALSLLSPRHLLLSLFQVVLYQICTVGAESEQKGEELADEFSTC
jgi:hypothetical protein